MDIQEKKSTQHSLASLAKENPPGVSDSKLKKDVSLHQVLYICIVTPINAKTSYLFPLLCSTHADQIPTDFNWTYKIYRCMHGVSQRISISQIGSEQEKKAKSKQQRGIKL